MFALIPALILGVILIGYSSWFVGRTEYTSCFQGTMFFAISGSVLKHFTNELPNLRPDAKFLAYSDSNTCQNT